MVQVAYGPAFDGRDDVPGLKPRRGGRPIRVHADHERTPLHREIVGVGDLGVTLTASTPTAGRTTRPEAISVARTGFAVFDITDIDTQMLRRNFRIPSPSPGRERLSRQLGPIPSVIAPHPNDRPPSG